MLFAMARISSRLSDSIPVISISMVAGRVRYRTCFSSVSRPASSFVIQTSNTRWASTAAGTAGTEWNLGILTLFSDGIRTNSSKKFAAAEEADRFSLIPGLFVDVRGKRKRAMIHVTRLNQSSIVLNCDLIEQIESTPDTVITLTNNQKLTVLETAEEIVKRIRLYRRSILLPQGAGEGDPGLTTKPSNRDCHG
jgi:flagellar protein FlbD